MRGAWALPATDKSTIPSSSYRGQPWAKKLFENTTTPNMSSGIREERLRRGVGVRELARRVGVTAGAVSQWERSEERGTIKRETLVRALAGIDPTLVVDGPVSRRVQPAPFPRPEQRRSYELHRDVARKLIDTPDEVLAVVPGNVERMRQHVHGPMAHAWLDEWLTLSRGPLGDLLPRLRMAAAVRDVRPLLSAPRPRSLGP